jgi:hypothetical protein
MAVQALHGGLVLGLWLQWAVTSSAITASSGYDSLFDGMYLLMYLVGVTVVSTVVLATLWDWSRSGFRAWLVPVDLAIAAYLAWGVWTRIAVTGHMTVGRYLAAALAVTGMLAVVAVLTTPRRVERPGPTDSMEQIPGNRGRDT